MKYSILLVDDEKLALMGIKNGISWNELGILNVYEAESMKNALKVLETHHVDIMICDIEMPGGSGLELICQVRKLYPQICCIFYTCHAEFAYCQEAMRLGAIDYVLKPIAYEELETIILRGLESVRKKQSQSVFENVWGELTKTEESEENKVVKRVKHLIAEHISEDLSREDLAKQVYMNPDYLTKIFKKETGKALSEYITEKRIRIAKELLKSTDLSIVQIADKTGFSYSSYFGRIFKKNTGITPQQYRNEVQKGKGV